MITTAESKNQLFKLADQMVKSFFSSLTAAATDQWNTLSGIWAEDVRVMINRSDEDDEDSDNPFDTILNASTSFWLPASPKRVFDYLRDGTTRSEVTYNIC